MKKILLLLAMVSGVALQYNHAQERTIDAIKAEKAAVQAVVDSLTGVVAGLDTEIKEFPGWKIGAFGVVGGSISQFSQWFSQDNPNIDAGSIGITLNSFANLDREKFFWRNGSQINMGWTRLDNKDDPDDNEDFEVSTDVFNINSLYGYKLTPKLAASALAEFRTTLLNNFLDPGYLDIGVGLTWTPITDLVVVAHPLNYNFVFADDDNTFQSSLGAKVVADYKRQLPQGISWATNLTAFISYEEVEDLSNYTWTNSFAYQLFKNFGIGFDFGLRLNNQETLNYEKNVQGNADATFDTIDSEIQTFWLLGATYKF